MTTASVPAQGTAQPQPPRWYLHPWVTLLFPAAVALADALLANDLDSAEQMSTALLAAAALLLRRRSPLLVVLLTLPGLLLSYIWLAPMLALYSLATENRRRTVVAGCAALVATVQFVPWPYTEVSVAWDRTTALTVLYSVLTAAAPVAVGLLVLTRRELAVRLDELTRGQERERQLLARSVLATERARLAREMHDVVSHQVSLISIQAGALQVRPDDPVATAEGAQAIRRLSVKTLEELRQMVGLLRAAQHGGEALRPWATPAPEGADGEGLNPQPSLADLPRLIAASGLDATLESDLLPPAGGGAPPWPEPVQRAAYRTVQEALTNVRKHAPGSAVTVLLRRSERDGLQVEIRNGPPSPGAEPLLLPSGGHGLVGLRERAQLLGGSLSAEATADGGFAVLAVLPAARDLPAPAGAPPSPAVPPARGMPRDSGHSLQDR